MESPRPLHQLPAVSVLRHALCIGNNLGGGRPCQGCILDAQRVARKLQGVGFRVKVFADLGYHELQSAMGDFIQEAQMLLTEGEPGVHILVVFFAGHAGNESGNPVILCNDAPDGAKGLHLGDALFTPLRRMRLPPRSRLIATIILDSCRDDIIEAKLTGRLSRFQGTRTEFAIIHACDPGGQAREDSDGGFLSTALIENIDSNVTLRPCS
mmetsp:Transcript_61412/g.123079  ORF Transcript_61412/g.123079 Transcript_61412/m.123079 type:complete len:211 (+) Transcript_61412:378-1010(+)